jgi:hypothetical protein
VHEQHVTLPRRAVIFIIVGPLFVSFRDDASVRSSKKDTQLFLSANETFAKCGKDDETHIRVNLDVTQLLAAQASMKVVADFNPYGDLLGYDAASTLDIYDNETLVIWFGKTKTSYQWGDVLGKQEFTLLLGYSGGYKSYTFYPFDAYTAGLTLIAYIETAAKDGSVARVSPVPICAKLTNHLSIFDYKQVSGVSGVLTCPPNCKPWLQ